MQIIRKVSKYEEFFICIFSVNKSCLLSENVNDLITNISVTDGHVYFSNT